MSRTLEQKIADAEARLARLKERVRKVDTRQKIVVGAVVLHDALSDPKKAQSLLSLLEREVTREIDQTALGPLLAKLRSVGTSTATDTEPMA